MTVTRTQSPAGGHRDGIQRFLQVFCTRLNNFCDRDDDDVFLFVLAETFEYRHGGPQPGSESESRSTVKARLGLLKNKDRDRVSA